METNKGSSPGSVDSLTLRALARWKGVEDADPESEAPWIGGAPEEPLAVARYEIASVLGRGGDAVGDLGSAHTVSKLRAPKCQSSGVRGPGVVSSRSS